MPFFFFRTKSDLDAIERTIKLLAGYHACPVNNEQFLKQYRHLITLYLTLCKQKGTTPCLET